MTRISSRSLLSIAIVSLLVGPAVAQQSAASRAEAQFHHAFYLQAHEHDLPGAASAYEEVANDASASEALRNEARSRLAAVREDLATVDFARLMPADVMGYAELVDPGEHIVRILDMLGLVTPPAETDQPLPPPIRLGDGLVFPADFTVSPALVAELKKLRGAAVGLTSLDDRGNPAGLAVVHPGDCDLLRGLIETGVQVLEPGEPIEGFKTWRIPDLGWVMLTQRLVLVSDSRDQLAAAVDRLRNPQAASLATREEFQRVRGQGTCALVFVDGQQLVKRFGSQLKGREAAMARALLDLEHFESLVATLSTTDSGIQVRVQANLMPGHRNMAYALIRTAPISKRSLDQVPAGSAGVVVLGLNPPGPAAPAAADGEPQMVSAMDIGREFFGNIEEIAAFALPAAGPEESPTGFPEVGVVIVVKNPDKSEALWNQILSLAALLGARAAEPVAEVTIEGKPGHEYRFDGIPPVAVVRSGERALVVGTQGAVAASIRAAADGKSIATDAAFAPLFARLTPTASKAVLVDVGRALEIAAALNSGNDAKQLRQIATLSGELKFSLVTDEAPNQFTIEAEITGLPQLRTLMPLLQQGQRPTPTAGK